MRHVSKTLCALLYAYSFSAFAYHFSGEPESKYRFEEKLGSYELCIKKIVEVGQQFGVRPMLPDGSPEDGAGEDISFVNAHDQWAGISEYFYETHLCAVHIYKTPQEK